MLVPVLGTSAGTWAKGGGGELEREGDGAGPCEVGGRCDVAGRYDVAGTCDAPGPWEPAGPCEPAGPRRPAGPCDAGGFCDEVDAGGPPDEGVVDELDAVRGGGGAVRVALDVATANLCAGEDLRGDEAAQPAADSATAANAATTACLTGSFWPIALIAPN